MWLDEYYPVGMEVSAADVDGEMKDGTITTHTCGMQGEPTGLIVRFDDGSWNEYECSFLDETGNYANSYVAKK